MNPVYIVLMAESIFIIFLCVIPILKIFLMFMETWRFNKEREIFEKLVKENPEEALAQVKRKYGLK